MSIGVFTYSRVETLETDVCAVSFKPDGRDLRQFPVVCRSAERAIEAKNPFLPV